MLSLMPWQTMLTIKALKLNTEFECPTTYVFCSDYTYMCDSLNESLCVLELLVLVWKYDILVLWQIFPLFLLTSYCARNVYYYFQNYLQCIIFSFFSLLSTTSFLMNYSLSTDPPDCLCLRMHSSIFTSGHTCMEPYRHLSTLATLCWLATYFS